MKFLKVNETQLCLKELVKRPKVKDLDDFNSEEKLQEYLESLDFSDLVDIYYIQSSELSRIRNMIFKSV